MIFHIPSPISKELKSGSQIRPVKMIEALEKIGYKVDVVAGNSKQRKKSISQIKQNIKSGLKYSFVYAENSTMPTLLTDEHHLPLFPFLDFNFLKFCKNNGLKIGLFYRDIYWVFDEYYNVPFFKKLFSVFFYKYDLFKYQKLIDIIFLPSLEIFNYFPKNFKNFRIETLYPAIDEVESNSTKNDNEKLNIFYVGGIGKLYEFTELLKSVKANNKLHLTVCVREQEWNSNKHFYQEFLSENISIVHKSGKELIDEYNKADITSLFMKPIEYRKFAMPIKLFEYLGYKKPVIASKNTAVGNFVEKNGVGWSINYSSDDLSKLFLTLLNEKNEIPDKIENICNIFEDNTWGARAKKVENLLSL